MAGWGKLLLNAAAAKLAIEAGKAGVRAVGDANHQKNVNIGYAHTVLAENFDEHFKHDGPIMQFLAWLHDKNEREHKRFFQNVAKKARSRGTKELVELKDAFEGSGSNQSIYGMLLLYGYFE